MLRLHHAQYLNNSGGMCELPNGERSVRRDFFFKSLSDGSLDKTKVVCSYYQAEFSYHCSTSSLRYHIQAKHTFGSQLSSGVQQTTLDNVRHQTMDQPTSNKLTVAIAK